MRTITCTVCLFILFAVSACTPKYYSLRYDVKKAPCFDKNAVPKYAYELVSNAEEIEMSLSRINGVLVKGMFPFIFKDTFNENNPLECSELEKQDIRAYVSLISQPQIRVTQPKEVTTQKETETQKENITQKETTKINSKESENINRYPAQQDIDNALTQEVKLVISSYIYSLNPADRLEKVYTLVTPLHGGVEFLKTEGLQEKPRLDIEFGKETEKVTLGTSSGIPVAKSLENIVSITPSLEKTIERNIARKYMVQNVEIFPLRNILLISQDGGPGGAEIGGNSEVKVTIRIPPDQCKYIPVFEIESTSPELRLKYKTICYVDRVTAMVASIAMVRSVDVGQNTIKEDDDKVTPIVFRNVLITDLLSNPYPLYGVEVSSGGLEYPVIFKENTAASTQGSFIVFKKFEDALLFRNWLFSKRNEFASNGSLKVKVFEDGKKEKDIQLGIKDTNLLSSGDFRVCVAGTSAPDLTKWFIPKRLDLCGGDSK